VLIFISGGVRSGKSALGERVACTLAKENRKIYLATAQHYDEEMTRRIQNHQRQRKGKGFVTLDRSRDIAQERDFFNKQDTVLLDCLGTLLANELFSQTQPVSSREIAEKISQDILNLKHQVEHMIIISNEVFSDGILYPEMIEDYLKILGQLHITLVRHSDAALECTYGSYQIQKGAIEIGCI